MFHFPDLLTGLLMPAAVTSCGHTQRTAPKGSQTPDSIYMCCASLLDTATRLRLGQVPLVMAPTTYVGADTCKFPFPRQDLSVLPQISLLAVGDTTVIGIQDPGTLSSAS